MLSVMAKINIQPIHKMKFIKRIQTTFTGSINSLLDRVENHEAVAEAALADMKTAFAKAQTRLNRLSLGQKKLQERIEGLERTAKNWEQRALQTHDSNKDQALECLKRKIACEKQHANLQALFKENQIQENRLHNKVQALEVRIQELSLKKDRMAAQDYAMRSTTLIQENGLDDDLAQVFERWEESMIMQNPGEHIAPHDELENRFTEMEEQLQLQEALEKLISSHTK